MQKLTEQLNGHFATSEPNCSMVPRAYLCNPKQQFGKPISILWLFSLAIIYSMIQNMIQTSPLTMSGHGKYKNWSTFLGSFSSIPWHQYCDFLFMRPVSTIIWQDMLLWYFINTWDLRKVIYCCWYTLSESDCAAPYWKNMMQQILFKLETSKA